MKGKGGNALVDLIAIVRHALDPALPLVPVAATIDERYVEWLAGKKAEGIDFSSEQMKWLDAIKDHISNSLKIDQDDFEYAPFNNMGGIGKVYQLFGEELMPIIDELNERLAA